MLVIILIVIAALAALGGFGWGISNFLSNRQSGLDNEKEVAESLPQASSDTSRTSTTASLPTSKAPTSTTNAATS